MAVYGTIGTSALDEDFLQGCNPADVIPGYASLDEGVFHVMEAVEADYNKMMIEAGVSELSHLEETGTEVVYESESKIKGLIDKAAEFFRQMWEKVQNLFQKAIKFFTDKTDEFRTKIFAGLDKNFLKKRVENLTADKKFGVTYEYNNINSYSKGVIDKIKSAANKVDAEYSAVVASKDEGAADSLDKKLKEIVDGAISSIAPNSQSASGMSTILKNMIRGGRYDKSYEGKEVNGEWVKQNWKEILDEVTSFPSTKRTLKSDYNIQKKQFNEAIKSCKKANTGKMFEANAYTKAIKAHKNLRQVTVFAEQAVISCLNERHVFYRSVVLKVIGSKPSKEDKKATNESTTIDQISSLFEW